MRKIVRFFGVSSKFSLGSGVLPFVRSPRVALATKGRAALSAVHVNKERFETYSTSGLWVCLQYVRGGGVRTGVEVSTTSC